MKLIKTDWSLFRPLTVVKVQSKNLPDAGLYVIIKSFPCEELHYAFPDMFIPPPRNLKVVFIEATLDLEMIPLDQFDTRSFEFQAPAWELPNYENLDKPFLVGGLGYMVQSQQYSRSASANYDIQQIGMTIVRVPRIDKDET